MDDALSHAFGRVEGKLDRLFDEVSTQGRTLAEHGIRLAHVEGDVEELKTRNNTAEHGVRLAHVEDEVEGLKTRNNADDRHGITLRGSILVGLCTVLASGAVTSLVAVFIK